MRNTAIICRQLLVTAALSALAAVHTLPAQRARPPLRLTVTSDGHALTLWTRAAPNAKGVVLFLHGRTWSALPDFDLQVPGEERSVMQSFVRRGYTVYALDARGYGATPRDTTGWLTPDRAADDVATVLRHIAARHPRLPKPTLVGWSYGSMVAHLTLQRDSTLASNVVLFGYPRDPDAAIPTAPDQATPPREATTAARAAEDFIVPGAITQRVIDAYVAAAIKADPVRADWRLLHQWNALAPLRLKVPTLLLQGEKDPYAPAAGQAKVFTQLGSADRQWIILPNSDHAALLENTLPAFTAAIINFIERPRVVR